MDPGVHQAFQASMEDVFMRQEPLQTESGASSGETFMNGKA